MKPYFNTAQFAAIPVQSWYTKREMIEAARTHGYEATEPLLDDWIKKGLLGGAERAGLGRGHGSVAWWPPEQFTLFIELLRARKLGKLRIGQLCAFPVWRWVYWGERGGVALPQVRRAMATWIASVRKTTTDIERKDARNAIEKIQGQRASGKLALLKELTAIGTHQKEPDPDLLRYLLETVITDQPMSYPRENGETGAVDIEMIATLFPLGLRAFHQYEEQIACLPDSLWEWGRTFLLFMQLQGQEVQPLLAKNRKLAERYHRLTIYDVLWGVCYDLLTPLSIAAPNLIPDKPLQDHWPEASSFLNYRRWQEGQVSSCIKTTLVRSSLLLPDGENVASLRSQVGITYHEKVYHFTIDLPFL